MDNFSATAARMIPGIGGTSGGPAPATSGFDMGAIPGFDVIQKLFLNFGLDPSFLVTLGMSLTLVTSLLSFFTYSFSSLTTLTRFISANLVSSATIHSSDVTYLYIMRWLATHRISTDCRLFCVTSRKNPQSYAVRRYSSYAPYGDGNRSCQEDDEDGDQDDVQSEDDSLGPKLKYTPAPGFLHFWHKGRPIIINRKLDLSYYTGDIPDETIVLTTIGRSPTFLREILSEARRDYLQAQSRKTMVYTLSPTPFAQKTWDQGRHRPSRDISTVIMPQDSKEHLLCDVKEYLNPVTMRWYAQRGLPYRRGYLFYGPPGTGKTSLSLALAGELKLPLYILSLSTGSLTDETLTMLFVGLPRKCIVLLEDIDCAGVHRSGGHTDGWGGFDDGDCDYSDSESDLSSSEGGDGSSSDSESSSPKPKTSSAGPSSTSSSSTKSDSKSSKTAKDAGPPGGSRRPRISVSFSGLLNAIDGVASHEGRILIMTTNHRERLDSALIRPGRVDVQIEFGYANTDTLAEIFRELYKEIGHSTSPHSTSSANEKERSKRDAVYQQADEFAAKIPANRFTPAEIQGFLMSYKGQPEKALMGVDEWVRGKLHGGAKKKGGKAKKAAAAAKKERKKARKPVISPVVEKEEWETASTTTTITNNSAATPPNGVLQTGGGMDGLLTGQDLGQLAILLSTLQKAVEQKTAGATSPEVLTPSDSEDGTWAKVKGVKLLTNGVNGVNGVKKELTNEFTNGVDGVNDVKKELTNGFTNGDETHVSCGG